MKPLINNRDLLAILPVLAIGYPLLYIAAVAFGSGPVPPLQNLIDNMALVLGVWVAAFVLNTVHWHVWLRQERRR